MTAGATDRSPSLKKSWAIEKNCLLDSQYNLFDCFDQDLSRLLQRRQRGIKTAWHCGCSILLSDDLHLAAGRHRP